MAKSVGDMNRPSGKSPVAGKRMLLGESLVSKGLLTPEQLAEALKQQATVGEYLGSLLVHQGLITEAQLVEVLSEQLGIPFARLAGVSIDPKALAKVPSTTSMRAATPSLSALPPPRAPYIPTA